MNGEIVVSFIECDYIVSNRSWVEALRSGGFSEILRGMSHVLSDITDSPSDMRQYALVGTIPEINGRIIVEARVILPSELFFQPGSIIAKVGIGAGLAWHVVQGVALYPDFREGLVAIQQDCVILSQFISGRLRSSLDNDVQLPEPYLLPPEEIEDRVLEAVRQSTDIKNMR